ncbi:MAG: hypothetical protein CM15mP22_3510 [Gammaproteobacteria bacterium]|nr:MAG: hypothetical protein CM15mP22_3510 [Gammaproteobacteria bacterium]
MKEIKKVCLLMLLMKLDEQIQKRLRPFCRFLLLSRRNIGILSLGVKKTLSSSGIIALIHFC